MVTSKPQFRKNNKNGTGVLTKCRNSRGRSRFHTDANDEFHGAIVENRNNLLNGNYASLVLSGNYKIENITKNGKVLCAL